MTIFPNKREHKRYPLSAEVHIIDWIFPIKTVDISKGGLGLISETTTCFSPGEKVSVLLKRGEDTHYIKGKVVHQHQQGNTLRFGVEF